MSDTLQGVTEIVAKVAKKEAADLTPESKLAEDMGIKSVGRIELAALLEDKFGIAIGNFEIRKPKTVAEVTELVTGKL